MHRVPCRAPLSLTKERFRAQALATTNPEEPGNSASRISYLHATHVLDPDGSIAVANGHYIDQFVRTPQGWRIAARRLHLISFVRLDSPAP